MELKPYSILISLITVNGIILALFNYVPFSIFIISLMLLILSLITLIGILIDSKLHTDFENSLVNRINLTIFLMIISLINILSIFLWAIKSKIKFSLTSNELDVFIVSIVIITLTFAIYFQRFKEKIFFYYIKSKVKLIVHPHKINPTSDEEVEITIINNSFVDLELNLSILPEYLKLIGQHKFKNKSTPYLIKVNKRKHIKQVFKIEEYKEFEISLFYNDNELIHSKITIF